MTGAATKTMAATEPGEARAIAWLQAWDSQPIHRTATPGDQAGAEWLAGEARALGAQVQTETFALQRLDPGDSFVEIDGARIAGTPMFDAPNTPNGGVGGLASIEAGQGLIHLAAYGPRAVYAPDFVAARRASQAWVWVVPTTGEAPGLALLNAEHFNAPFGPAILQVVSSARDSLFAAAKRGAGFRVVVDSRRTAADATNIVITIPGRDRGRPPVVVMTPRSSWFQSTSERGGGLVCWLESLRAVLANPPGCDTIFTANSGHELGHIGLDAFLARRPGMMTQARWVHFGANIGAADSKLAVMSGHSDMAEPMAAALARAGQKPDQIAPTSSVPFGESRDIHRAGGRYVTLVGSNKLFHLAQDRLPHAVDFPAITRIAAGAAQMVLGLTR